MGRNVFPMLCSETVAVYSKLQHLTVAGLIMGDQPNMSLFKYAIIDESLTLNPFINSDPWLKQ